MPSFAGECVWLIGASSGIGEALAHELARQGARLVLSARRVEELNQLNETLGDAHHVMPLDVSDSAQVRAVTQAIIDQTGRIDRVIFMAAIFREVAADATDDALAKHMVEVNLLGAIYTAHAVLPVFDRQRAGQIALCGSIAGYTGLPGGQPYCATKAAIISLAESLYAQAEDYVDVKLISPGFVRTRITDKNNFWMPMRIEPEQAAKAIARGLNRRAFEIHFPKAFTYWVKLLRWLPYPLTLFVTRRLRGKA